MLTCLIFTRKRNDMNEYVIDQLIGDKERNKERLRRKREKLICPVSRSHLLSPFIGKVTYTVYVSNLDHIIYVPSSHYHNWY